MNGYIHSHFTNKWNLRNASTTEDLNYSSSVIILPFVWKEVLFGQLSVHSLIVSLGNIPERTRIF